jgi:hypothetical protein
MLAVGSIHLAFCMDVKILLWLHFGTFYCTVSLDQYIKIMKISLNFINAHCLAANKDIWSNC